MIQWKIWILNRFSIHRIVNRAGPISFDRDSQEVIDLAVSGLVRDAEDDVVVVGPHCAALRHRPVEKRSRTKVRT